jgi:hypothetical protein
MKRQKPRDYEPVEIEYNGKSTRAAFTLKAAW